ncbi:hypothetical protein H8E88_23045 [candidate division KSB1 bacterium]|nr:hypothetical protein [candidate division KSB1 bacterium]
MVFKNKTNFVLLGCILSLLVFVSPLFSGIGSVKLYDLTRHTVIPAENGTYQLRVRVENGFLVPGSSIKVRVFVNGVSLAMIRESDEIWTYTANVPATKCINVFFEVKYRLLFFIKMKKRIPKGGSRRVAFIEVEPLAEWVESLQLPNGAIKVHEYYTETGNDGKIYHGVVPYFVNLGVLGLLRSTATNKLSVTKKWIDWYLQKSVTGSPPGIVLDHWYRTDLLPDQLPETMCPNDTAKTCDHVDAWDSVAATFLLVACAYMEEGGDVSLLNNTANANKFRVIADVILNQLQDKEASSNGTSGWDPNVDGDQLVWNTPNADPPAKYLMDNSEVYSGLLAMAQLEEELFGGDDTKYQNAARAAQNAIFEHLYDCSTGLYHISKQADATVPANLNVWYSGTANLVWPGLFGITEGDDNKAIRQLNELNRNWPNWKNQVMKIERESKGFLWPSVGYAALKTKKINWAKEHTSFVICTIYKSGGYYPGYPYFNVDDAGWLLRTISNFK